jgi:osmotically-inducible protein OsmY
MKLKIRFKEIKALISLIIMGGFLSCSSPVRNDHESTWVVNDTTLETAILKEFETHPHISIKNFKISAQDGVIKLTGTADNLLQKKNARELITMIRGVKSVIDLVDVKAPAIEDKILQKNIDDALYQDPILESYKIEATVDNGIVDLTGKVDSWHEMQLAKEVVSSVTGVTKVLNNIAFVYKENRPVWEIKANIVSLLRNDARIDDGMISVEVKTDTAILSGHVGSAAEKSIAVVHAWVPGIKEVMADDLTIALNRNDPLLRKDKYVKKSDPNIIEAIQETFLQDPRLLNHDILIKSEEGHVTLSGAVDNLRSKKAAEEDTRNVVGVWQVTNNIQVVPVLMPVRETIQDNIRTAINRNPLLQKYTIQVESDSAGSATLKGNVNYFFEKLQAEDIASAVTGVVDIANKIEVTKGIHMPYAFNPETPEYPIIKKPVIKSDEQIKEDVAYQLWWSPFVDRNQITLQVNNGKVTLQGTVNTAFEMDQAVRNAYEGGAFEVDNQLKVDFWQI